MRIQYDCGADISLDQSFCRRQSPEPRNGTRIGDQIAMQHTNWVYTLIRAIDELGGEAHVSQIGKSHFVQKEQSPQVDVGATIRGSVHDYCSDHASGRKKGASKGNARDVFKKIGPATWKIRDYSNPFVKIALRDIESIEEIKQELIERSDITAVDELVRDIDVEKTVHVDEHWRTPPTKITEEPSVVFHLLGDGPNLLAPSSHAIETEGWLLLTGQLPNDPLDPSAPIPKGISAQTQRVLENLKIVLASLDLDMRSIIVSRCYLAKLERDYENFFEVYRSYFQPDRFPATTIIGVNSLPLGATVQVEVVARRRRD